MRRVGLSLVAVLVASATLSSSAASPQELPPCEGLLVSSTFGYANCSSGTFVRRGARDWRVFPPPPGWAGARMFSDLPTFRGRRGVVPLSLSHGRRSAVAFYATADGGRSWRLRAVRRVARAIVAPHSPFVRYVPTAVASPTAWWFVSGRFLRTIHVTRDAGRNWRVARPPTLPGSLRAEISALNSRSAWLTSLDTHYAGALFATTAGGRSWRRLAPR